MPRSRSSSPSRARFRRRRDRRRRSPSTSSSRSPSRSPSRRPSPRLVRFSLLLVEWLVLIPARTSESARSPPWVPQPLCCVSGLCLLLPRPDPDSHLPVVAAKARKPLCPFMPSCGLLQVDLAVPSVAAFCARAVSMLSLCASDAMSRIGGLRQLARLTGAAGPSDQTSSGPGSAAGGPAAPAASASIPVDGGAVAAPAAVPVATGGDGSAGPAASASPGPAHDGSGGDGATAPPTTVSKSSGAAFLAAAPGPTPRLRPSIRLLRPARSPVSPPVPKLPRLYALGLPAPRPYRHVRVVLGNLLAQRPSAVRLFPARVVDFLLPVLSPDSTHPVFVAPLHRFLQEPLRLAAPL